MKEESLLLLSDLQKLINQVVLIDYTIIILGSDNDVFLRGSGQDSALVHKTECVNGICMLPQYVWIKGLAVVNELNQTPEI